MEDLPILDGARIELISRGNGALAHEFLQALIDEATETIGRARALITAGDQRGVADLAHTLKGMAAELGALRLRAAAAALEVEAQPNRWAGHLDGTIAALAELRSLGNIGSSDGAR
jgi:HPt (histidine-containing phosphotransfer) domain-containing protein